jgi:type II secretory pathway pseudopilin PulG
MKRECNRATTLLELLIALIVLSMVLLAFYNIQLFSDYQVVSSNRKAVLQNEAITLLEHITKQLKAAVSNGKTYPADLDPSGNAMRIWVDNNGDGVLQDNTNASPNDRLVFYLHAANGSVFFCNDANFTGYSASSTLVCNGVNETLATHMNSNLNSSFIIINNTTNYVTMSVKSCWDPTDSAGCGSLKNPSVSFTTQVDMPSATSLP